MDAKTVEFKIVRDDGAVFIIDDASWRIPENGLSGWHSLNVNVSSLDNVTRDGGIVVNQRVGMVDRTIVAEIRDQRANQGARRQAERFFLPKRSYTVFATYMGRTRKCDGVQAGFALSEGNVYEPITLTWTIFCADPYMKAVESEKSTKKMKPRYGSGMPYMVAGTWHWQESPRIREGFVTGIGQEYEVSYGVDESSVRFVENAGDVPSIPRFEFSFPSNAGSKLDIDIRLLSVNMSTNGKYHVERVGKKLEIKNVNRTPSGSSASTDDDFLVVDLSSRPFRVFGLGSKPFTLGEDSLLRDPYVESGLWAFEYEITFENGQSYETDMSVEIVPMFTGV